MRACGLPLLAQTLAPCGGRPGVGQPHSPPLPIPPPPEPRPRTPPPRHSRRDMGARTDRQKARLMWLVEDLGVEEFKAAIEARMGTTLRPEVRVCGGSGCGLGRTRGPARRGGPLWAVFVRAAVPSTHRAPRTKPRSRCRCTWSTRARGLAATCWACTLRSRRASTGWAPVSPPGACRRTTFTRSRRRQRGARARCIGGVCVCVCGSSGCPAASATRSRCPAPADPPPHTASPRPPTRASRYGDGTVRLTVEENVVLPNVPEAHLEALQAEPIFEKFAIHAGGWGGWAAGGARCGWDAVRWGGCVGGRAVFGDWLAEHHAVLRVAKWQPRRAHTHPRPPRSPAPPPLAGRPPAARAGVLHGRPVLRAGVD